MPLPLSDFQDKLRQVVEKTPSPGKHAARSAIVHLQKGWELRQVDSAMAVFRGITGDEESVTAIFHALKARHYKGADKVDPHRHLHKAAMVPFLAALEHGLRGMMALEPTVVLRKPTSKLPRIRLRFAAYDRNGEKYAIEPQPPLHGVVHLEGVQHDFTDELQQLASIQKTKTIMAHIRKLANERNRLLYAGSQGIPEVQDLKDEFFIQAARRVFRNLAIYLFIIEYKQRQDFVQQALDAFLKMLGHLPDEAAECSG